MRDYYEVLEVPRVATEADVGAAFKKLALKWHPKRNSAEEAESRFQELGEAYAVLSSAPLRAVYDQYGSDGLQRGAGEVAAWTYPQNAHEQFEAFFGTKNPFANFGFGENVQFAPRLQKPGPRKMPAIVKPLECTLEELYNGCVKTFEITRKREHPDGGYADQAKTLRVNVRPGWKRGTVVTFACEGDEGRDQVAADVVFQLVELPHPHFERKAADLIFTAEIPLSAALAGTVVDVPTLDGRVLAVAVPEVIAPGYVKIVPGEGMPDPKKNQAGDLVLRFKINFPKYLSQAQKSTIAKTLAASE